MHSTHTILRHIFDDIPSELRLLAQKEGISYKDFMKFDSYTRKLGFSPEALLYYLGSRFTAESALAPTVEILLDLVDKCDASFKHKTEAREVLLLLPSIPISESNLKFAFAQLKNEKIRYEMMEAVSEVGVLLEKDPQEALRYLRLRALDMGGRLVQEQEKTETLTDAIAKAVERYRLKEMGLLSNSSVKTGFTTFDDETGGLDPGRLLVIGGFTSVGKSAILLHMAWQALLQGKHVVFATVEMYTEDQIERFLCMVGGVPYRRVHEATLSPDEYASVEEGLQSVAEGKMHIIPPARCMTLDVLAAELSAISQEHPVDMLVVDYLNIVSPGSFAPKNMGGWEKQGIVAQSLRNYGLTYHCPVVTAAQMNKGAEKKANPSIADLGLSHEIPKIADYLLYVLPSGAEKRKVVVKKARFARKDWAFALRCDLARMQFTDEGEVDATTTMMEELKENGLGSFLTS